MARTGIPGLVVVPFAARHRLLIYTAAGWLVLVADGSRTLVTAELAKLPADQWVQVFGRTLRRTAYIGPYTSNSAYYWQLQHSGYAWEALEAMTRWSRVPSRRVWWQPWTWLG